MPNQLEDLEKFCLSEGRVCPMPVFWERLWGIIKRADVDREVPVPLILAAWDETTHLDKMVRLVEQLQHAEKNGALDAVDSYLRELPLSRWLRSETSA
jgi:hypothetical protein